MGRRRRKSRFEDLIDLMMAKTVKADEEVEMPLRGGWKSVVFDDVLIEAEIICRKAIDVFDDVKVKR